MKQVCMIATSLDDTLALTPLIKAVQKEPGLGLTLVHTHQYQTPEMEITHRRLEEEGFLVEEQTRVRLLADPLHTGSAGNDFGSLSYPVLIPRLNPDILVLFKNSQDTFRAAMAAMENNIPIAHIQGGEADFGQWEDSYGYGITKLSHLHFTAAAKYRQRVIDFGEHPDRVYNVGSLVAEQIRNQAYQKTSAFYSTLGWEDKNEYILIHFDPDPDLGSQNAFYFQSLLDGLNRERLADFHIVFKKPAPKGLGKLICEMTDAFIDQHPSTAAAVPAMNLSDSSLAVKLSSVVISNNADTGLICSLYKKPMVSIGTYRTDKEKTGNIIDCGIDPDEILTAVQNGLSAEFQFELLQQDSPFDRQGASDNIVQSLKAFNRSDICPKAYFIAP